MRRLIVLAVCLAQSAALPACGGSPVPQSDPAADAARALEDAMDRGVLHGAAAVIIADTRNARVFGGRETEPDGAPIDEATVFRLASLTKLFTQIAILRLADNDRIDLDAPLARYRPGLNADWADEVTVRDLLAFRSGLPRESGPDPIAAGVRFDSGGGALAHLDALAEPGPQSEPGARTEYSNLGYFHLGGVIEQVTGQTLADAVARLVCEPAGLRDTGFGADELGVGRHAQGHVSRGESFEQVAPLPISVRYTAGGMHSSLRDLERLTAAILGGDLLTEESADELFAQFGRDAEDPDSFRAMGHVPGFGNVWHVSRSPAFAVISLNNAVPGSPRELLSSIDEAVAALAGAGDELDTSLPPADEDWTRVESFDDLPGREFTPVVRRYIESFAAGDADEVFEALLALHGIDASTLDDDDREDLRGSAVYELEAVRSFGPFRLAAWRDEGRDGGRDGGGGFQLWLRGPGGRAIRYTFEASSRNAEAVGSKKFATMNFHPDDPAPADD